MAARLVPDLDDELIAALGWIEELLLGVAAWEQDDRDLVWPEALAGGLALEAVRRIWDRVAPTQGMRAADSGCTGRLFAPDGVYEHLPLRLADVDSGDVQMLAAAVRVLGDPLAAEHVRQSLEHGADIAYRDGSDEACTRLVVTAARVAGLLDLGPDRDSEVLAALVGGEPAADVVLSVHSEGAYQRYARRLNLMWTGSDALALYLY
jgi:hypothetical protein